MQFGLKHIRVERSIDDDVNWRPTISGDTTDHHLVCIEVTDGAYTSALDNAVLQLLNKGLPVRLYVAYPGADIDAAKVWSTFRIARERGIGIVEVRSSGNCVILQPAIDLSLAALTRTDPKSLLRKYRQDFSDAETTFLNGDPAKGCARIYDELEALTRKFASKAARLNWWNPGGINIDTGSWASILNKMNRDLSASFTPVRNRCPDLELTMLSGVHGLTGHRNESGHKPKSRNALIKRDKR